MSGYWPRPEVLDQIPAGADAVIEASAGTGKTYTLEHLVIDLVLRQGLPLDQILVVTFTEKAAAELSARVRGAMTRIHQGPWTADAGWKIDDVARTRLSRALTSFDNASISTIHAFCRRLLSEHAFANGRLFEEELVDGRAVFQETFLDAVRSTLATDQSLQPYLTAWLQRDSLDGLADRLYEAHVRTGRFVPAFEPAALTAVLKSLGRMELTPAVLKPTLSRARLSPSATQATLNRIKALRTIIDDLLKSENLAAAMAAMDTEDRQRHRDGGLVDYLIAVIKPAVDDIPRLAELYRGLRALQDARVSLDAAVVQLTLPVVQARLHRDKRRNGRFDFDDMLVLIDEALRGSARDTLLRTLRQRFKVALIDEFQDTDRVQWEIFRQVFADSPRHRLVVIGDPKQAIYGFRGADVHTYLAARAHLTRNGTPVVHLTDTYRATPELAEGLNRLLDQKRVVPFFTGEIRYEHPVRSAGEPSVLEVAGQSVSPVHVFEIQARKDSLSPVAAGRTVNHRIAQEVARLLETGRLVGAGDDRPLSASDIFVLTRTTKEGVAVGAALRTEGLPFAFYKQDGLFQTTEAQDVRHLLAAIAEPQDRTRRLRAWLGPFYAVPLDEAQRCLELPTSHPLLASLFRFRALADEKRWARLFPEILSETGIIQRELLLSDSERELTNYLHIFEVLLDEALRAKGTLADLLHTLSAFIDRRRLPEGEDGNVQRLESERAAVQVMTMHKAKGLEAAVVFLTGGLGRNPGFAHVYHHEGERRLYLGDRPPNEAVRERDEEDQRLGYVALTRAKNRLYLPMYGALSGLAEAYEPIDRAVETVASGPTYPGFTKETVLERPPQRRDRGLAQPVRPVVVPEEPPVLEAATVPDMSGLRTERRGAIVTSYSRLKEAQGGYQPAPRNDDPPPREADGTHRLTLPELAPDELPGGTASGVFVHEMLELTDLETVRRQAGWSFWAARPEIRAIFQRGLRRYDRRPEHLDHSYRMVFDALTTPLQLGAVRLPEGIAGADRVVREMEFMYAVGPGPKASGRGYVKGFIDVVIEHEGRVIVLDWKTDLLPSYEPKALTGHVDANYGLQADLYTLALLRLLKVENTEAYEARFAGTAYIFVRGLNANGHGVYFTRPTWNAVVAAQERLLVTDLTGGRS